MKTSLQPKGNDTLVGNNENNILIGGEGNDQLTGGIGYDILNGGSGQDDYIIQAGTIGDITVIKGFNTSSGEKIDISAMNNQISGFSSLIINYNKSGSAVITCPTGQQIIIEDVGNGSIGSGHFTGNASVYESGAGNDVLHGGNQNDYIKGNAGNDQLYGYGGMDTIDGGKGSDIIYDGAGNDSIIGGEGSDSFVIYAQESTMNGTTIIEHDIIADFDSSNTNEKLYITGYGNKDTAQKVLERAEQINDGIKLHLLDGKTVLLENVSKNDLTIDHFVVGDGSVKKRLHNKVNEITIDQNSKRKTAIDENKKLTDIDNEIKIKKYDIDIYHKNEEVIQANREKNIGSEFNISDSFSEIGEIDVKQINSEQFIVAWNEINGDTFDTHVQVFNQYGDAINEDTIISTRSMLDNHEDVAINNINNGKFKIGTVGEKNNVTQSSNWTTIQLNKNNEIEINELITNNVEQKTISKYELETLDIDLYGESTQDRIKQIQLYEDIVNEIKTPNYNKEYLTIDALDNGIALHLTSNIEGSFRLTSKKEQTYIRKMNADRDVDRYYEITSKYYKTIKSNLIIDLLMGDSHLDMINSNNDAQNMQTYNDLVSWESNEKNYKTIIHKVQNKRTNWDKNHVFTKYNETTKENPDTLSEPIKYNACGFEYKSGIGVCYQTLNGDNEIELRVKIKQNNGSDTDIKIHTMDRSSNETQFISKAHQLNDGRIIVIWTESDANGIGTKIKATIIDKDRNKKSDISIIENDNGYINDINIEYIGSTKFIITWTNINGQDGDGSGVYQQTINVIKTEDNKNSIESTDGNRNLVNIEYKGNQINKGLQMLDEDKAVFFWSDENEGLKGIVLQKDTQDSSSENNKHLNNTSDSFTINNRSSNLQVTSLGQKIFNNPTTESFINLSKENKDRYIKLKNNLKEMIEIKYEFIQKNKKITQMNIYKITI